MAFHWSLSNSKSPQVSRTFLSILANHSNAVVWKVSSRPLISNSSSPCTNPLVTILSTLITIGITVTFMFHDFFSSLARSKDLYLFSLFCGQPEWQIPQFGRFSFFWLTITRSGRLAEIKWSVGISKTQWNLCATFSRTDSCLCMYNVSVWSNLNLHTSQ